MCAVVLVFCLSLRSRQEPLECMLLSPVPWPSMHKLVHSAYLLVSSQVLKLAYPVHAEFKPFLSVIMLRARSESPQCYLTCRGWGIVLCVFWLC